MRTSALFGAKNFGFFEIMVCPHGQAGEGVEPVRTFFGQDGHFSDKKEGVNFLRFCADVFYARPLTHCSFNGPKLHFANTDTKETLHLTDN